MTTPGSPASVNPLSSGRLFANTSRPRLQALYSDFSRQKQSNPTAFHTNVEWWRKALEALVDSGFQQDTAGISGARLVLHANHSFLDRVRLEKIGKPLAMGAVVNELRSDKTLILLTDFMNSKASVYDPGWLPYRIASFVVGRPLWWALEQVGIVGDEGILSSTSQTRKDADWWGEYIMLQLVEKAADTITSLQETRMTGPADALYTFEGFRRSFASIFGGSNEQLGETDARVLVKYLERERKVLVLDDEVVKFVDNTATPEERLITVVDHGILELKSAISNIQHQVDGVQNKMNECTKKAMSALQQERRPLALSYLRSRKQLEGLLNKRLASLGTLEGTMISIETAAGDIQIMKTFESSTATLRAILAHSSLQGENIDKTMDALAEANQNAREVDSAIRIGGDVALDLEVTDLELEEEWKALVKDVETGPGIAETLNLPQVPNVPLKTIGNVPLPSRPSRRIPDLVT